MADIPPTKPCEELNRQLASACMNCGSSCCKKGWIFLPRDEFELMFRHAESLGGGEAAEFTSRISDHGSFLLYDQRDGCQFLDERNLCRLHEIGLKPSECFWWPYHVFVSETGGLEVRLATDCCDAHKAHDPATPYVRLIEAAANRIGFDVIREFRNVYGSTCTTRLIAPIQQHDGAPTRGSATPLALGPSASQEAPATQFPSTSL